jgi:G2/mitotic-specific cyclin 1/2
VFYSGYEEKEMSETVSMMLEYLQKPVKYEAVFKKYSQRKFMKGAIFVQSWIAENRDQLHPNKAGQVMMKSLSGNQQLN